MQNNQINSPQEPIGLHLNKKLQYASLLLHAFMQRPADLQHLTLQEYISHYAENLTQPTYYLPKVEEQLLVGEYLHIRHYLQSQIQNNISQIRQKGGRLSPVYQQIKNLIAKRQLTCIKSLLSQLQNQRNDQNEQVIRIRKIIENKAWGCLDKLQQRIAKLKSIQNEMQ